jgi:hypothetical protein
MSALIRSQQSWKKAIENPSRPGALSLFIPFTTSKTSLSLNGNSRWEASSASKESKARSSNLGCQSYYSEITKFSFLELVFHKEKVCDNLP